MRLCRIFTVGEKGGRVKEIIFYCFLGSILINTIVCLYATNGHGFYPKNEKWEGVVMGTAIVYLIQLLSVVIVGLFCVVMDLIGWLF